MERLFRTSGQVGAGDRVGLKPESIEIESLVQCNADLAFDVLEDKTFL